MRYVLVAGATVAAGHAAAATRLGNASTSNTPANLGKVTVTGTRIKRTDIETAQPITRISRQQIQQSGYTNIGQLLGQLSSAGAFLNTSVNNGGSGATLINLRNLGVNRNLVLVDGKRWISGLAGATNLNTIPTSVIDHIEILQDGASAVYGSDAIAGVVNIVTIHNYNGAEANAYYAIRNDHQTGSWDGQVKKYSFTVGSGNDRGNVVFNAEYREQNPIFAGERVRTRNPVAGVPGQFGSSGTPKGRFQLQPTATGTCPNNTTLSSSGSCDLTLINAPATPSLSNFRDFIGSGPNDDHYNYQPANYLQTPLKDVSTYVEGHYDLFDNLTFTAKAAYIRDSAKTLLAPEPLNIGAFSSNSANGKQIGIAASNPYNPFGVDLVANTQATCLAAGSCDLLSLVDRRQLEAGPRINTLNRDYFHINAGFNGYVNLFNREIDWDVGFAQNRVQAANSTTGDFNTVKLAQALGPAAQCNSPCVPFNFFGGSVVGDGGSITQDQLNYTQFEAHNIAQTNLRDWTANLSSDVIDLPAGPLGVAIGYERVDNYGYSHPDSIIVSGNTSGNSGSQTNGRVVRNAEYAELNIPLLSDLPGAKDLSLDIANRWTQFKRAGGQPGQNTTSYVHNSSGRLNIRYQVINDLLLRASWSQGFRSPNVSELFFGTTTAFPGVQDPCAEGNYGGHVPGTPLPSNCPNGNVDIQGNSQIPTTFGGNPNLQPERSISRSVGFVYSPSQVPGLDLKADYFKIEITNRVGTVGANNIVKGCFFNSTFCNLVTTGGNRITNIRNTATNVGSELTEGIDVGIHYKFPSTPFGDFSARISGTFLKAFDFGEVNLSTKTGFATSHLAGVTEQPRRRFNGYINWDYGNWTAQYHLEYLGHSLDTCGVPTKGYCTYPSATTDYQGTPGQLGLGKNHLGATVYHDVHIAYTVPTINTTFSVGALNLFDKKPPITGGGGYDHFFYRLPSREIYGSIRVRF